MLNAGGDLSSIDLNRKLGHASFFEHWKVADFLIKQGADVNYSLPDTGETPLHSALCKAGRPYFLYVLKVLVENGADVNGRTIPGKETGGLCATYGQKAKRPCTAPRRTVMKR